MPRCVDAGFAERYYGLGDGEGVEVCVFGCGCGGSGVFGVFDEEVQKGWSCCEDYALGLLVCCR